jgi:hypothetical protein
MVGSSRVNINPLCDHSRIPNHLPSAAAMIIALKIQKAGETTLYLNIFDPFLGIAVRLKPVEGAGQP